MTSSAMGQTPRRRIFGWMMFDWASQPFYTLCLTFIFGPYITGVLAEHYLNSGLAEGAADAGAQQIWSWTQAIVGIAIAICAPLLGAMADRSGNRMGWVAGFSVFYVVGAAGLWLMLPDASQTTLALVAFGLAMVGAEFTTIFTNAMLPGLVSRERTGSVSGTGYAIGYAGGLIALFIMLLLFEDGSGQTMLGNPPALGLDPEAREGTRFVGPLTAIWYVLFMIPFFLLVREPRRPAQPISLRLAMGDVVALVRKVPSRPSLFAWLVGSMLLRDALNALYAFGGVYAKLVLNWETMQIGIFGILGALTAVVASALGGRLDSRHGPKPVITAAALILTLVVIILCGMSRDSFFGVALAEGSQLPDILFYILGATIGGAGGVLQAAARTMMVRHSEPERATEAFGLYALSGKATAFLAPALIGLATLLTGSAQLGIAPVALLFLIGLFVLKWVNPQGDR